VVEQGCHTKQRKNAVSEEEGNRGATSKGQSSRGRGSCKGKSCCGGKGSCRGKGNGSESGVGVSKESCRAVVGQGRCTKHSTGGGDCKSQDSREKAGCRGKSSCRAAGGCRSRGCCRRLQKLIAKTIFRPLVPGQEIEELCNRFNRSQSCH